MKNRIVFVLCYVAMNLGASLVLSFTLSGAYADTTPAPAPGSDGVELQMIPIDLESQCNQVVLRGTNLYKNYAFTMPRALIATDKYQRDLFGITPTQDGGYLLRFALHFPTDNEELTGRFNSNQPLMRDCNSEDLLNEINRDLQPGEEQVRMISALPVSRIRVTVDGIATPALIGSSDTTILRYAGQTSVVEFYMDAKTKADVLSRLQGDSDSGLAGLGIHLDVVFTARSSTGVLKANIDTSKVADAISAQFGGGVNVAQINLAALNLQAVVSKALETTSSDVYVEGDNLLDTAKAIIASVTGEQSSDEFPGSDITSGSDSGLGTGPYQGSDGTGWDTALGLSTPGTVSTHASTPSSPSSFGAPSAPINLGVFLTHLRDKKQIQVNLTAMGDRAFNTFSDSIIVQANPADSNEKTVDISSDNPQEEILESVDGSQPLTLVAQQVFQQRVQTQQVDTYFNLEDLQTRKLDRYFSDLRGVDVSKIKTLHWESGDVASLRDPSSNFFDPRSMVFGLSESVLNWSEPGVVSLDLATVRSESFPLRVAFTKLGIEKSVPLSDLGKDNPGHWDGRVDEGSGSLVFQSKEDLGNLVLVNTADPVNQDITTSTYFEEHWDNKASRALQRTTANPRVQNLTTQRTIVRVHLSAGQSLNKNLQRMNLSPVQGGNSLLVVP